MLPTSKPFGPGLVKSGTRPGVPSGLAGLVGAPYARNSVDLVITGINRNRRTSERILSGERAFSNAKKLITPERNALADATIKATECLKAR